MIDKCPLCILAGGRFQAQNYCCQVRKLADAPGEVRRARYETLRQEQGKEAVNTLIVDVNAELTERRVKKKKTLDDAKNYVENFIKPKVKK